jgi:hypothetical protein
MTNPHYPNWRREGWWLDDVCELCYCPSMHAHEMKVRGRAFDRKWDRRMYLAELWGRYSLYEFEPSERRRIAVARATPWWVNERKVLAKYEEARLRTAITGRQYHVDHIVPVQSDVVCGLHVEWNLRIVTAEENMSKRNKLVDRLAVAPVDAA